MSKFQKLGKRLEEKSKRFLMPFLLSPLKASSSMKQPTFSSLSSILLLRQDKIGDMIISTGILRLLKQKYPKLRIGMVASPSNAQIVSNCPDIDDLFIYHKRLGALVKMILSIRRMHYEMVVNLVLYSSLTGGVLTAIAAGSKGYRVRMTQGDDKGLFYHRNIIKKVWGGATRTMLEETTDIFAQLGVQFSSVDINPTITLDVKQRADALVWASSIRNGKKLLGLNIAAGVAIREAPPELWKQIIDKVHHDLPEVQIVLFTPLNGRIYQELLKLGIPSQVVVNPPHQGIMGAAALLEQMNVVLSTDTSIPHLCSALGIPVVTLFHTHENSVLWAAYGVPSVKLISPTGYNNGHSVDLVVKGVAQLLIQ